MQPLTTSYAPGSLIVVETLKRSWSNWIKLSRNLDELNSRNAATHFKSFRYPFSNVHSQVVPFFFTVYEKCKMRHIDRNNSFTAILKSRILIA